MNLFSLLRPVAVLLVAVLHYVTEEDDPGGIVAAFRDLLVPGSHLVVSHVADLPDQESPTRVAATHEAAALYEELAATGRRPDRRADHRMVRRDGGPRTRCGASTPVAAETREARPGSPGAGRDRSYTRIRAPARVGALVGTLASAGGGASAGSGDCDDRYRTAHTISERADVGE